ncbi:MAG: SOS response-associated peptidase, partial [Planktomarina sp.]|nr:SOS response-associated peptidase [Planktomarina sp.]
MCGRMAITMSQEAMTKLFSAVPANDLPMVPNYNVCPT